MLYSEHLGSDFVRYSSEFVITVIAITELTVYKSIYKPEDFITVFEQLTQNIKTNFYDEHIKRAEKDIISL